VREKAFSMIGKMWAPKEEKESQCGSASGRRPTILVSDAKTEM
jgi:hypothetical protein